MRMVKGSHLLPALLVLVSLLLAPAQQQATGDSKQEWRRSINPRSKLHTVHTVHTHTIQLASSEHDQGGGVYVLNVLLVCS